MLKDRVVLAVICLIVVGAVFVLWTQTSVHFSSRPPEPQAQAPEPAKPAPAVVKAIRKPKLVLEPVPEPPAVVEAPPAPVVVPVVQHDPPPFPVVAQIAAGAHEDSITGKYGDPALSAVTSTDGHMVETFVYAKNRGREATVIRIEDGKVSSAYSQSEPVPPSGLSAPRRWHNN